MTTPPNPQGKEELKPYVCDCGTKTSSLKGCCGENEALKAQLGEERDRFGKVETELMVQLSMEQKHSDELAEAAVHLQYCDLAGTEIEFRCKNCEKGNKVLKNHRSRRGGK